MTDSSRTQAENFEIQRVLNHCVAVIESLPRQDRIAVVELLKNYFAFGGPFLEDGQ